jgi:hypothetical protein
MQMPELTGIHPENQATESKVILTTAYPQYARRLRA